jgi:hypothetical protein
MALEWLTNGQGTPWGATEFGKPNAPQLNNDPWSVAGLDQSPLRAALMQRIAANTGQQQQAGQAGLAKAGLYDSSQQGQLARDIAGSAQGAQNNMEAGLQQQDYQNRMGLMNEQNQNALQNYGIQANNYNAEQQGRNQFWGGLAQTGGQLAGMGIGAGLFGKGQQPPANAPSSWWGNQGAQPNDPNYGLSLMQGNPLSWGQ